MYQDEIISELWRIRDAYAAEHHHDLKEMVAALQEYQTQSGHVWVDRRPTRQSGPSARTLPSSRRE